MTTLPISKIFEVENMLDRIGTVTAAKMGLILARNGLRISEVTKAVRQQIQGSFELQVFRTKQQYALRNTKDALKTLFVMMELAQQAGVADELKLMEVKEQELLSCEAEIDWIPLPESLIPGLKNDDGIESGILPLEALRLFYEVGIIPNTAKKE